MVEESNESDPKEQESFDEVQSTESNIDLNKPSSSATTKNFQNSALDRDMLVTTAVHFLNNSKVKNVPLSQKRAFLLRKGLTNEDIDIAIERVNSKNNEANFNQSRVSNNTNSIVPFQEAGPMMVYREMSIWYRWKEFASSLMVIGATFYGFYYIFKKFIEPLIIGKKKEDEDRMSKIERHLTELNKSLTQLRHSLVCVESSLCKQQTKTDVDEQALLFSSETIVQAQDIISLNDIKNDVASIKSLLLSRNQFPAAPTSSLSIPSWQLKQQEEENKQKDDDKESDKEFEAVPNGIGALNGNVSDQ